MPNTPANSLSKLAASEELGALFDTPTEKREVKMQHMSVAELFNALEKVVNLFAALRTEADRRFILRVSSQEPVRIEALIEEIAIVGDKILVRMKKDPHIQKKYAVPVQTLSFLKHEEDDSSVTYLFKPDVFDLEMANRSLGAAYDPKEELGELPAMELLKFRDQAASLLSSIEDYFTGSEQLRTVLETVLGTDMSSVEVTARYFSPQFMLVDFDLPKSCCTHLQTNERHHGVVNFEEDQENPLNGTGFYCREVSEDTMHLAVKLDYSALKQLEEKPLSSEDLRTAVHELMEA